MLDATFDLPREKVGRGMLCRHSTSRGTRVRGHKAVRESAMGIKRHRSDGKFA